jgi:ferredoxin
MASLEVSIVQEDCTACGLCAEEADEYFFMADDGLAYVKQPGGPKEVVFKGFLGKVAVAPASEGLVIEMAEECPGECIYVEVGQEG